MRKVSFLLKISAYIAAFLFSSILHATSLLAPLPSWNNGSIKQNIIQFVKEVTDKSNAAYVAPPDRIAVFDNDDTLWVEQPLYPEMAYYCY